MSCIDIHIDADRPASAMARRSIYGDVSLTISTPHDTVKFYLDTNCLVAAEVIARFINGLYKPVSERPEPRAQAIVTACAIAACLPLWLGVTARCAGVL